MSGIIILTTTPGIKTAKLIAQSLVKKKLAACVSLSGGFTSVYRWKGAVETAKETLVLIKTVKKNFNKVKQAIKGIHPYELPEIVCIPITLGSAEYLSWLNQSLKV